MKCKNIFGYLNREVFRRFKLYQKYRQFDRDTVNIVEKLKQYCCEHYGREYRSSI